MNIYIDKIREISSDNKYCKWYIRICENAYFRTRIKKEAKRLLEEVETHHILPKSFKLGGEKDEENLVHLSLREHFICHWLLTKMLTDKQRQKMNYAFLCISNSRYIKNSNHYKAVELAKKSRVSAMKGRKHSEEHKANFKKAIQKRKEKGLKTKSRGPCSEETKEKLRGPRPHTRGQNYKDPKTITTTYTKTYMYISPQGEVFVDGNGLSKFCLTHNLNYYTIYGAVGKGKINYDNCFATTRDKLMADPLKANCVGWEVYKLSENYNPKVKDINKSN